MANFAHLNVHTQYSFYDSTASIESLVDKAAELGFDSLGITDVSNMSGIPSFCSKCEEKGIKPIVGCSLFVAKENRFDKSQPYNCIELLVINDTGYKNLIKLNSLAWIEGLYYKPRIDFELLQQYNEGLICLSGELQFYSQESQTQIYVANLVDSLKKIFDDRFYIEITNPTDRNISSILKLAEENNIKTVASNSVRYTEKEDFFAHEALFCMGLKVKIHRNYNCTPTEGLCYLKSEEEMTEFFAEYPNAVSNTVEVADRCNFKWNPDFSNIQIFEKDANQKTSSDKLYCLPFPEFSRFAAKMAVKKAGSVLCVPKEIIDRVAGSITPELQKEARKNGFNSVLQFLDLKKKDFIKEHEDLLSWIDVSEKLENCIYKMAPSKNKFIYSDQDLMESVPLCINPRDRELYSQYCCSAFNF